MLRILTCSTALLLLCLPAGLQAADGWAQLKIGMTPEETVAALGRPMMRSAGNGFEVWIYDEHAEIVFFGSLIGWTKPGPAHEAGLSNDVWQINHPEKPSATFLAQLPLPVIKPQNNAQRLATTNTWLPVYGFRR